MAETVTISAKWLESMPPPSHGRVWYSDKDLRNFHVCATHTGAKIYYRVGRINGKMTRVRLGAYPAISAKVARGLCLHLNGEIAAGHTVNRTKRSTAGDRTFKDAWEWYRDYHSKPNKRTWARDVKIWDRDLAHLGGLKLPEITRPMLIELVAKVTESFGGSAGNRVIELTRGIFTICVDNDWSTKNPATKIPKHKSHSRTRFLLPEEIPAFFGALTGQCLGKCDGECECTHKGFHQRIRDFFFLCIFTGARRSNVMAMRWDELDLDRSLWVIPHIKSKNKLAMVLPLAQQAVAILLRRQAESRGSPWVFPSNASATGHYAEPKDAWRRIKKVAGLHGLKIHDLRRTLASWQAGMGISLQIIGKTLGHKSQSSVEIYARLANEPVRLAIQNAIVAIETAAEAKKSQKSPKSD